MINRPRLEDNIKINLRIGCEYELHLPGLVQYSGKPLSANEYYGLIKD